ncbi:MAG: hypothetical protein LBI10_00900 [Deltaproteobacteria bacterium]|nr:hypothetical protein [Deltaproteobacteria bacterium]
MVNIFGSWYSVVRGRQGRLENNGFPSIWSLVFSEQCLVDPDCRDEATKVKAKNPKLVPSNSLQNPSDP